MMQDELKEYLNEADANDLMACLRENFNDPNQERHFKLIAELYFNDPNHFKVLSAGCKAAAIIYILVRSK